MAGWKDHVGKKVFIELKRDSHPYSGKLIEVEENQDPRSNFIVILDRFNKRVQFAYTEIAILKEEA